MLFILIILIIITPPMFRNMLYIDINRQNKHKILACNAGLHNMFH